MLSVENDEADMLHGDVKGLSELRSRQDLKSPPDRIDRNDGGIGKERDDLSFPDHGPGP